MNTLLSYSLAVSILLLILAPVTLLVINGNSFQRFNRWLLLSTITLCLLLPIGLMCIKNFGATVAPELQITLNEVPVFDNFTNITQSEISGINVLTIIGYIYLIGIAVITIYVITAFLHVRGLIGKCRKEKHENYTLCIHNDIRIAPFSFMGQIVIAEAVYQKDSKTILLHESSHITKKHWLDLMYIGVVTVILWYNPMIWLLRDKLRQIHEYEADKSVIDNGVNPLDYQKLLITTAINRKLIMLTNSFASNDKNFSKRIRMIGNPDLNSKRRALALLLIPASIIAVAAVNNNLCSEMLSAISRTQLKPIEMPSANADAGAAEERSLSKSVEGTDIVAESSKDEGSSIVLPSPLVDPKPLAEHVAYSISYSELGEVSPNKKVLVDLSIDEDGKISSISTRPENQTLNVALNDAFQRVEFDAYYSEGKPIKIMITLPIVKGEK